MQTGRIVTVVTVVAALILLLAASSTVAGSRGRLTADNPNPPASTVKLIFIHHSCGSNWLRNNNGGLGIALRDSNYFVSDTNYGWEPDSIGNNTDIGHWWSWFRGPLSATYLSDLYAESDQHSSYSRLPTDPGGENQIIMFKSCYPNSNLRGHPAENPPPIGNNPLRGQSCGSPHHTVANAKSIYNDLLEYFASRQDKLFVVITAPPVQNATYASNARAFNTWLVEGWLDAYPHNNVAVFDFYNVLTSNGGNWHTNDLGWATGNHHRHRNGAIEYITDQGTNTAAYPNDGNNNHPSPAGNQKASGEFVPLLNIFYNRWKGTGETPTPTATGAPPTATPTHTPTLPHSPTPTATSTGTPPTGQQTMIFQDGVSPDGSYAGTADVILANDEDNVAPNANLGGLDHLETFFGEGEEHRRCLMRWDLSALPDDAAISGATVELYRYEGDAESDMRITLYRLTGDWDEGTGGDFWPDPGYVPDGATWALASPGTPWTTPGGDFDTTIVNQITLPATLANGWIPLDATTAVRAWIEQGVPNYGLLLRPLRGDYTYHYYYSRNYPTANLRPRLAVTYTVSTAATPTPTGTGEPSPTPTPTETPTLAYRIYLPLIMKGWSAPPSTPTPTATVPPPPGDLIQPSDLTYLGAFRLPDVPGPDECSWKWSNWGSALTYHPDGDPNGPSYSYPGSLFGTGHDWNQWVSEVSIPVPVISPARNLNDLHTSNTLQPFHDIRDGLFGEMELARVGLAHLPPQGAQTTGKLYFAWAEHAPGQPDDTGPSHGWAELDLAHPQPGGPWRVGGYPKYVTGDYLFPIPNAWADDHASGQYLATGRFRDGGQGAEGPSLFAIGPWNEGNVPPFGATIPATPLLLYENVSQENPHALNSYHHSDEWSGGAWLRAGDKAAVIFVGSKGTGDCWYGCADGTVWPDEPPYPPDCPERGWWSTGFEGQIIFYDPADLAAVARRAMETWEPQPYATLSTDEYLYHLESSQQKQHLGAASFDRERGLLYVFEPLADGDKSLIHAWRTG